mmetsp:Transcript_153906/g.269244  ORF Transcript_153906/g.269244 Transcript_153906/m.269244 type:complete len:296 (-) Transcript_153906:547-1434(-)
MPISYRWSSSRRANSLRNARTIPSEGLPPDSGPPMTSHSRRSPWSFSFSNVALRSLIVPLMAELMFIRRPTPPFISCRSFWMAAFSFSVAWCCWMRSASCFSTSDLPPLNVSSIAFSSANSSFRETTVASRSVFLLSSSCLASSEAASRAAASVTSLCSPVTEASRPFTVPLSSVVSSSEAFNWLLRSTISDSALISFSSRAFSRSMDFCASSASRLTSSRRTLLSALSWFFSSSAAFNRLSRSAFNFAIFCLSPTRPASRLAASLRSSCSALTMACRSCTSPLVSSNCFFRSAS